MSANGLKVFLLFFLLIAGRAVAYTPFSNLKQVAAAEKNLSYLEDDKEKVKTVLNLSYWYNDHFYESKTTSEKSIKYAYKAYSLSKSIDYPEGFSKSCLQLAVVLQKAKQYLKAKVFARKAVTEFEKLDDQNQLGESWVMYWSASFLSGTTYKDRIPLLQHAALAFRKAGNKPREADCYKELGDIYQLMGNGPAAIASLKRALALYEKTNYEKRYFVYDLLNSVYLYMGDHKTAIAYGLEAARIAEKIARDSLFLCTIYNRLGATYFEFQDYDKAQKYFMQSLNIAVKFKDIPSIRELTYNYSDVLLKQNKTTAALTFMNNMKNRHPEILQNQSILLECQYVEIYIRLKQYTKAEFYITQIKKKIKKSQDYLEIMTAYHTLIKFSFHLKNYSQATFYSASYDSMAKILNNKKFYANASLWKYAIDSAQGNCSSAMNNYRDYVRFSRNLYDEHKTKEVNQMTILYETEKKDKNIIQLQNSSIIQQTRLRHADIVTNLMIISIISLLIILTLLYRVYRLKQRTNKILSEQQNEIHQKNAALQNMVSEKEWLLREIHHRVKNNLHMVVGLLASQAEFLKNEEAVQAINDSQNRIQSMSLIHQKLYQSENLSMINMPSYIFELTEYLKDSLNIRKSIRFALDIDNFDLPLSHSIPIGLIFNEAVTNSIKYAFPNDEDGKINISMKAKNEHDYVLTIEDNGIGLPLDFDPYNYSSLGIKLMHGLSEDIDGNFEILNHNGTTVTLEFTINKTNMD